MRRPHVFERSAPRTGRNHYQEPANQAIVARTVAAQLGNIVDRVAAADLPSLEALIEAARIEAERLATTLAHLPEAPKESD